MKNMWRGTFRVGSLALLQLISVGVHNFYKSVIIDLEERTESPLIREVAIATLEKYLKGGDK